jgi:uncharacterized membrane protein
MEARTIVMLPATMIALMIGASLYALAVLPADVPVTIHASFSGKPDLFARPLVAFSILPAAAIGYFLMALSFVRKAGATPSSSRAAFVVALGAPLALLAVTHGLLISYSLGIDFDVRRILTFTLGLMLVLNGNLFGKLRWNRWVGIKTRYTLSDEWVWDRTQRFAGWVLVGAGTTLALCALVIPAGPVLLGIEFAVIAVIMIAPARKSVLLWRQRHRN